MKRKYSHHASLSCGDLSSLNPALKRANSSLFSIATIVDEDDDDEAAVSSTRFSLPSSGRTTTRNVSAVSLPESAGGVTASGCGIARSSSPNSSTLLASAGATSGTRSQSLGRPRSVSVSQSSSAVSSCVDSDDDDDEAGECGTGGRSEDGDEGGGFYIDDDDDDEDEEAAASSLSTTKTFLGTTAVVKKGTGDKSSLTIPRVDVTKSSLTIPRVGVAKKLTIPRSPAPPRQPGKGGDEEAAAEVVSAVEKKLIIDPTRRSDAEAMAPTMELSLDNRTGLVFESGDKHHDVHNRFHKERPIRVLAVRDHLSSKGVGVADRCVAVKEEGRGTEVGARDFLDDEDFLRVHLPGYMKRLDSINSCTCQSKLDREAEQFQSIYLTPDSVREAKAAATSVCTLVERVVSDELDNGFAVVRPPGHHAEPGLAGGYCVINNVAVAAGYAREKLGVEKVLIVDWDVHHGNGTQDIFLKDPNVLYFSVHRHHGGNFFPFLRNGGPTTVGLGDAAGFNVNVGWNRKGMGDREYRAVWARLLMPIAREFRPDLVLVSAGFDAAEGDMGECKVTPECFGTLTRSLMTLAGGKVVCTLEGGYVRGVLSKCVESVVRSLLEHKVKARPESESGSDLIDSDGKDVLDCINSSAASSIRYTIACHRVYWSCLRGDMEAGSVSDVPEEKKDDV